MTDTARQETRAQRRPHSDGERTCAAILRAAASLATVTGWTGWRPGTWPRRLA